MGGGNVQRNKALGDQASTSRVRRKRNREFTPDKKGKRIRLEIENSSDSECLATTTNASNRADDAPNHRTRSKSRENPSANSRLRSSRTPLDTEDSWYCEVCHEQHLKGKHKANTTMLQCQIETCASWYHLKCLLFTNLKPMLLLFRTGGIDNIDFICPNCFTSTEHNRADDLKHEMAAFHNTIKVRAGDGRSESSVDTNLGKPEPDLPQSLEQEEPELKVIASGASGASYFEPASREKLQGFDEGEVNDLVRQLSNSINTYSLLVWEEINKLDGGACDVLKKPLKKWKRVVRRTKIANQSSQLEGTGRDESSSQLPITAMLRDMLDISVGQPLKIDHSLKSLPFVQVHDSIVGWFVYDVLDKRNINDLPNMKPITSMSSAVAQFANERWPGSGLNALREVQLRTWFNPAFQEGIHANDEKLRLDMDDFLEPITRKFNNPKLWEGERHHIAHCTIALWSYVKSSGGSLKVIQPKIGDDFDQAIHALYDSPSQGSDKKIKWIVRRGFILEEDGLHGRREMVSRALVMI